MLAALVLALAPAAALPELDLTLLGWTADGRSLAYTSTAIVSSVEKQYYLMKGDERVEVVDPEKLSAAQRARLQVDEIDMGAQDDETAQIATVRDARTGEEQRFLLKYKALTWEGKQKGELKKAVAGFGDAAAFDAWKQAHPVSKVAGRGGKGGGKVDVAVKVKSLDEEDAEKPVWKGASMSWSTGEKASVAITVTCGADRSGESLEQEMDAMYMPQWTATPYWDPTGRRVLLFLREAKAKTMRGPAGGRTELHVLTCGPRVQVVAAAGMEAAAGKVADSVEAAGFAVVGTGPAKQARAATVIYADEAHAAAAARLAAALPGGATVDKLTWKPPAEIVVAVGESAR